MSLPIEKTESSMTGVVSPVERADGKTQLDQEQARELAASYNPDSPVEKGLVRKLDWRLVVS